MHKFLQAATFLMAAVFFMAAPVTASADWVPPFKGNDTGGIISWSPQAQQHRHEIAGDHCAQYGKVHRITSLHAWYGDYIGFACYRPRGMGREVILRRAY